MNHSLFFCTILVGVVSQMPSASAAKEPFVLTVQNGNAVSGEGVTYTYAFANNSRTTVTQVAIGLDPNIVLAERPVTEEGRARPFSSAPGTDVRIEIQEDSEFYLMEWSFPGGLAPGQSASGLVVTSKEAKQEFLKCHFRVWGVPYTGKVKVVQ